MTKRKRTVFLPWMIVVCFLGVSADEGAISVNYGRKICRAHVDKHCASDSKKPGYSCAMCAGHYWSQLKPYCNPHKDKNFDINEVCRQKTENRIIRKGTHEKEEKAACVHTLTKYCAKDNGKLPRNHQKCIDCARRHQQSLIHASCFVSDVYEICHASFSDDKHEQDVLKRKGGEGVNREACDLMIHDQCRKSEGKDCIACINEHWPEFRPRCIAKSCSGACEYHKKALIEMEVCEAMKAVSIRDKAEGEDDDDDQSGIQEERIDDSANTVAECRTEINKMCGSIYDFKCKQCAVQGFAKLQEACYNLDTVVHACHAGDDDDDVAYKKGIKKTNLKKDEDLDEGDDDAAQLERMEKFCRKNVNVVCNIGDPSKDTRVLIEQLHTCAACMDTKWDQIKQFCLPWWDNAKEKNKGEWDRRNELCAFGILNKDEDFIKLGKNGQIDVRKAEEAEQKNPVSTNSQLPATVDQKKKLSKDIVLGCEGMITFLCGTPKTGAECMHCVSKHWVERDGGQSLMDSCDMFDDALTVCAKDDNEKVHMCIKQLAKHKCLAGDSFEGCMKCADSIVSHNHKNKKKHHGTCDDKLRRKSCEHMFPNGNL